MTERKLLDDMTSDQLDHLYDELDRLTAELADYDQCVEHLTRTADPELRRQFAAAIKALGASETEIVRLRADIAGCRAQQWPQRLGLAEKTLARIAELADEHPVGIDTALIHEALDEPARTTPNNPAADAETTTRVFAALHQSAEEDVTRVINLYEQWVKAGPPPLGIPTSRWWDARMVELHDAIRPPADKTATEATGDPT
jgi:hypothetical protein